MTPRKLGLAALLTLAGACRPPSENLAPLDANRPIVWEPGSWAVVWSDEFEGPAGTAPDPTKWSHELGGDGWGNRELQSYTDSTTNSALDGAGNLVITARAEMAGASAFTSARLTTKGHFARTYGRFEARMRLAKGRGLWPAFWLLGDDFDTVGWPACGEMDVVEEAGSATMAIGGSVHGPQRGANLNVPSTRFIRVPPADEAFHVYAVEWDPDDIVFLFDDVPYFQVRPSDRPKWVYDHPFFMTVNLAVGGLFPGPPDESTMLPQSISVDYVRVSTRGAGPADGDVPDGPAGPSDAGEAADGGAAVTD